jgi:NAD(P)-dependent dehydrogenase (short-subunit alcohol dehydrogenase family)
VSLERFSLAGRTALVTGGSRGLGAAFARGLADAGADVAVTARSLDALGQVASAIAAQGRRGLAVPGDITVPADVERVVETVVASFGSIDILVNNAGGPVFNSTFLGTRPDGWARLIDLNLTSVVTCCRIVGAHMVERGCGAVVNIGSPAGLRPWPAVSAYGAAKAAVLNLTQALAQEWARSGVRVNMVTPGWIRTDVNAAFTGNERASAEIAADVPAGRWGEVDDVVGAVVFLASDAAAYVTGVNLPVDGGLTVGPPEDWRWLRVDRGWLGDASQRRSR